MRGLCNELESMFFFNDFNLTMLEISIYITPFKTKLEDKNVQWTNRNDCIITEVYKQLNVDDIQSTLVNSNSRGPSKSLRVISTLSYPNHGVIATKVGVNILSSTRLCTEGVW